MAKAVFTGEEVKKLTLQQCTRLFGPFNTVFSGFSEDFFMRNSPGHAGNWNSEYKQPVDGWI